ncbi:MAG: DUF6515 family protein [Rikenellaceae bacterium]
MKKSILITLSLLVMVVMGSGEIYAQNSRSSSGKQSISNNDNRNSSSNKVSNSKKPTSNRNVTIGNSKPVSKPVTVVRNSKPKIVNKVPSKAVTVRANGNNYYRNGSRYYKYVNSRYVLTMPPFGLRVSIIPALHSIFRYNNLNYYCADGVIYRSTSNDQFEVVQPQVGMIVPELPVVNVSEVVIDGMVYFEFEGILYKQVPTQSGLQYEVMGSLSM